MRGLPYSSPSLPLAVLTEVDTVYTSVNIKPITMATDKITFLTNW